MRNEKVLFDQYCVLKLKLYRFVTASYYELDLVNLRKIYLKLDYCINHFYKIRENLVDYRFPKTEYTLDELKLEANDCVIKLQKIDLSIEDFLTYPTSERVLDKDSKIDRDDLAVMIKLLQELQSYLWIRFIEKFQESIIY